MSSDEDEDELYSEEEEDDDDYYQSSGKKSKNKEFRIYRPLDPPITKQWSIADLHVFMHQGLIDLDAPYQRDVVWGDSKQVQLIDSIFRNFYIPPIIFAIHIDDEGHEIRYCVDGKQRLTSIAKFMDGQIPHQDSRTKKKYWFTRSPSATSRALLPESYQKRFKHRQVTCIEYTNLKPGDERDLFQRVQLGMSLTEAEKMQAHVSPITDWIHMLRQKFISSDNGLQQNLNWKTSRGQDFLGVAQLCFLCWHLPKFVHPSNAKLKKWFYSTIPSISFQKQVQKVLESYVNLSLKEEYRQGFTELTNPVAPAEFMMIGVLLAKMYNCSWDDRARQVLALRQYVRRLEKDIRTNERVMKTMWTFIEAVSIKGATFDDWEGPEESSAPKKSTTARKTTQVPKRAREESGDEDFRNKPGPSKRSGMTTGAEPKTSGNIALGNRNGISVVKFVR